MNNSTLNKCKLCNSERLTVLGEVERCSPDLKEFSIKYYLCEICASVFHNQLDFLPVDYYGASYFDAPLRMASLSKSMDFILEHIDDISGLRALDVGCSNGNFMLLLRESGFDVCGIELSSQGRSVAASRGLEVYDSLDFIKNNKFQLVAFNHVLEHLDSPAEFLGEYIKYLDEGAAIYIEVPSIELLSRGRESSFNNLYPNHVFHFSENSIYELGKMINCTTVAIQHHNYLNYPSMMCLLRKQSASEYQSFRFKEHLIYENKSIKNRVERIHSLSGDRSHVVIWGCSDEAYQLISGFTSQVKSKLILIDASDNKIGKLLLGFTVSSPDVLKEIDDFLLVIAPTTPKVVQSIKHEVDGLVGKDYSICMN